MDMRLLPFYDSGPSTPGTQPFYPLGPLIFPTPEPSFHSTPLSSRGEAAWQRYATELQETLFDEMADRQRLMWLVGELQRSLAHCDAEVAMWQNKEAGARSEIERLRNDNLRYRAELALFHLGLRRVA